mmetsp:Transcript_22706/g.54356  ORF Transcript_22706/g.54356 Transcript_22706/m.54356 type:complete len:302 (-) Transcript_22706:70-975(-)
MSISPYATSASVRGIGVADSVSTCGGGELARCSADRCRTPNLCCSSMTARPSLLNSTPRLMSECVPMTMPIDPSFRPSSVALRGAVRVLPVRSETRGIDSPSGAFPLKLLMSLSMLSLCWAARTSVGAMSAACQPDAVAASIARRATAVLPEPTSPCSSLSIGLFCRMSRRISEMASACPAVSCQGSDSVAKFAAATASSVRRSSSSLSPDDSTLDRRRSRSPSWSMRSSWNAIRCRACSSSSGPSGKCMALIASIQGISLSRCTVSAGRGSSAQRDSAMASRALGMIFCKSLFVSSLTAL